MKLIRAGLAHHHNGPAIGTPILGRVSVDIQLELLHRVDDGIKSNLSWFRLQNTNAVI